MNKKTLWITETAVMIALLVALQWATKPLGQFVTGSCVNLVLGVSVLVGGLWCGLTVALVCSFLAFRRGSGPAGLFTEEGNCECSTSLSFSSVQALCFTWHGGAGRDAASS